MRMPGAPPVEAEDEFVEVGLEMLAAQPVVYAQGPDLDVGEDPVNPREHDVGGHLADDMRIVGEAGSAGISGPTIGFGGGAGDEVGREKGTEAGGRVIGDLVQPDAAGTKTSVLDLECADDQHFALMAAPAAGDRILLAAAHDFGFVDLDKAGQRFSVRGQQPPTPLTNRSGSSLA